MKSGFRSIIYILSAIIILSGLALFFYREEAVSFMQAQTGVIKAAVPVKVNLKAGADSDVLGSEILKNPKFIVLANNVTQFDFDSICKTAVGQTEVLKTDSSTGATSSEMQTVNCRLGNNIPFSAPAKAK